MGCSFKRWNTEPVSTPSGHGIFRVGGCEPPGIFFRVWDEYPVLRLKEACTLVGKSQQSLKSFTTCQMKNYMKRNRHQMVSYISCCKTKINLDFIPEAEIQARHLKNFVKEMCVCVCVCFPHNLIVIMHLCAPFARCAAFLKTPLTGSVVTCLPTPSQPTPAKLWVLNRAASMFFLILFLYLVLVLTCNGAHSIDVK